MTYQTMVICLLLMMLAAVWAFFLGYLFALRLQRRRFSSTGYTMIGGELYSVKLLAAPDVARELPANRVR